MVSKILKYLTNKRYRFIVNANKGKYDNMPDREYVSRMFEAKMGRTLDLDNPLWET